MPREAVIIGAGLAGSSCALSLAGAGWNVKLLERSTTTSGGAGIVLHPNAMDALAALGLADRVQGSGTVLRTLVLSHHDGATTIALPDVWSGSAQPTVGIARAVLSGVLDSALAERGIPVARGHGVMTVTDGAVPSVTLEDGRVLKADVVVGCDGLRSTARTALGPAASPTRTGLWWARWIVPAPVVAPGEWIAHTATTVSGAYAIGAGRTHLFLQAAEEHAEAAVARAARESPVLAAGLAAGATLVHAGPGWTIEPHRWRGQRVVLAGDAAHALSPTMSEGGGLALEDGVVLGAALEEGTTNLDDALARYEDRRSRRVAWAARMGALQLRNARRSPDRYAARAALSADAATTYLHAIYEPLMAAA